MHPAEFFLHAILFALALAAGLLLTPPAAALARRAGLVDRPGGRKAHRRVTPYGGGIALFVVVGGLLGGAYLAGRGLASVPFAPSLDALLAKHREGLAARETFLRLLALGGGATAMFVLGLVDDARGLRPRVKLAVQALAALGLVAAGIRITFFLPSWWIGTLLTVLWVVGVTNAFNLLDNMDGLSGGVAAVASGFLYVVAAQGGEVFVGAALAVLAGGLVGFLRYNFPPARLFLGDAGALFAGFLLAGLTVAGTYYPGAGPGYGILMPVLILGVPLFDTATVLLLRWRRGRPLFVGDTNHFSHRLLRLGMTRREAVLTNYLFAAVLGGLATLLGQLDAAGAGVILLVALGVVTLILLLETAAVRRGEEAVAPPGDRDEREGGP